MGNCQTFSNTAQNYCAYLAKTARRIILVPEFDGSYTKNEIASEAGVTAAELQALFQNAAVKSRYYPLPLMENVEEIRNENDFYDYESGNMTKVKDGTYHFSGFIPFDDAGPALLGRLQDWYGQDFGCYIIDVDGNFRYNLGSSSEVQPFLIDGKTWSVRMVYGKYKEPMGIEVQFNFKYEINDKDQRYIKKSDLDFDGRTYNDVYALRDVDIASTDDSLTTLVLTIATDHGVPVTGLAKTDMYLYNSTDPAEVTISTAVESTTTPGTYTLTFSAQTEADAWTFNLLAASKYDPADTATGTFTA